MSASALWQAALSLAPPPAPLLLLLLLAVSAAVLWDHLSRRRRLLRRLPGPRAYPLIGNLFDMPRGPKSYIPDVLKLNDRTPGGLLHLRFGGVDYVLLTSAESAETLLRSRRAITKSTDYDPARVWMGDGLLLSTGDKWHQRRKLLTPAFHNVDVLESFLEVMNENASALVKRLEASGGQTLDVMPLVSDTALNILAQTAMGVSLTEDSRGAEYITAAQRMGAVVMGRFWYPWLWSDFIFWLLGWKKEQDEAVGVLHSFTRNVIRDRRRARADADTGTAAEEEGLSRRKAFLDLLLSSEEGAQLTDEDVAEEVDTFMFEGHDTTTSGIVWTMFNIARFPDVQRKVHAELDDLLPDTPPTREDLAQLQYLGSVIKESHRLFPPVPNFSRNLRSDETIAGYEIPAGTNVSLFPHVIHRDPRHWPEPEKFDPDRHRPETAATRHPFALIPFSAGPRNCIGQKFATMEEKAILSAILRRFSLETDNEYSLNMFRVVLTLQADPPVRIRFVPRGDK